MLVPPLETCFPTESYSNSKHDTLLQGKFSDFWTLHTCIVNGLFVNEKCRYHCPKANHVHSFLLYCLSLENFKIEISEIFRVQIRAIKIHAYLWSIILFLWIFEIVRKFATRFMFTFLQMDKRWTRCMYSGWAWGWRWSSGHGLVYYHIFVVLFI